MKTNSISEFRRDLVTGNWILIARGRADRPGHEKYEKEEDDPISSCPFEDPKKHGNEDPILINKNSADWTLQVIPNKYPAVSGEGCPVEQSVGPYSMQGGLGFHEILITRDHSKHMALMASGEILEVLSAYKSRYLDLAEEECVRYISIFHNHGRRSGASLTHPHSQLIAIPIMPSDFERSFGGSESFYKKNGKCVHCVMIAWELEDKKRVIFENSDFVAVCPYVSRGAYEVRIYPKAHSAWFEKISESALENLSQIFKEVLASLYKKLDDPAYNFYLHTAAVPDSSSPDEYAGYHWHFDIRPRISMGAGFELSTGIEISTVEPEYAAQVLRS